MPANLVSDRKPDTLFEYKAEEIFIRRNIRAILRIKRFLQRSNRTNLRFSVGH